MHRSSKTNLFSKDFWDSIFGMVFMSRMWFVPIDLCVCRTSIAQCFSDWPLKASQPMKSQLSCEKQLLLFGTKIKRYLTEFKRAVWNMISNVLSTKNKTRIWQCFNLTQLWKKTWSSYSPLVKKQIVRVDYKNKPDLKYNLWNISFSDKINQTKLTFSKTPSTSSVQGSHIQPPKIFTSSFS